MKIIESIKRRIEIRKSRKTRLKTIAEYEKEILSIQRNHINNLRQNDVKFKLLLKKKLQEAKILHEEEKSGLQSKIDILEEIIRENRKAYETYRECELEFGNLIFDFYCDIQALFMKQADAYNILGAYQNKFEAYKRRITNIDPEMRKKLFLGNPDIGRMLDDLESDTLKKISGNVGSLRNVEFIDKYKGIK